MIKKLTIEFDNFNNDSMQYPCTEVSRMLKIVIEQIEKYGIQNNDGFKLRDYNGNTVGEVTVEMER